MSTEATWSETNTAAPRRSAWNVAYQESRCEFLKVLRMPAYSVPTIAFPVMFYLLFGVLFGRQQAGPTSMSTYLLATYGAFGVIGAALFGFCVIVILNGGSIGIYCIKIGHAQGVKG